MVRSRLTRCSHIALLTVSLLLAGCRMPGGDFPKPEDPTARPPTPVKLTDPDSETGPATVEEIEILLMESFPIQVAVLVKGYLPDGCTVVDQVRSRFEPESDRFMIEITTLRDADAACTQAIVPFEERVHLDVYGLSAGTYFVDANGVVDSFTFDVDNSPVEESGSEVPWDEARLMILAGEVAQVTQLHSLQVTLTMRDGRRLVTYEPEIDDVIEVLEECGERCSDIILATE
jgi:inhibitor of cysteine peptidase